MRFFGRDIHNEQRYFLGRLGLYVWCLVGWMSACGVHPSAEVCKNGEECQQKGLCGVHPDGSRCAALQDTDCKQSRFCVNLGECSLDATLGRCVAKTDDECRSSSECKLSRKCLVANGACVEITTEYCRLVSPNCRADGKCALDTKNNVCVATTDVDCQSSANCAAQGRCSVDTQTSTCVVKTDADCQRSDLCRKEGGCGVDGPTSNRQCVPKSDLDCRTSASCQDQEKATCAYDSAQKRCVKGTEFCRQSAGCRQEGTCFWFNLSCVAGKEEDCKNSEACTREGRCHLIARACVRAADSRCGDYPVCRRYGECSFDAGAGACVVASDADCARSLECWLYGRCTATTVQVTEGGTTRTRRFCRFTSCTEPCRRYGRCHISTREGVRLCVAKTDADCTTSEACQSFGMCKYQSERCVFDSDCKIPCQKSGHCEKGQRENNESNGVLEDGCIAKTEEGCVKSESCQQYGTCSFDQRNSRCVATSCLGVPCGTYGRCFVEDDQGLQRCGAHEERDCLQSATCQQEGLCKRSGTLCVASDSGCAASALCKERGRCHADALTGRCTAKEDKDCAEDPCKHYGRCKILYESTLRVFQCIADKADDCVQSKRCREELFCTLRERDCSKSADCSVLCTRFGQCERVDDGKGSFGCKITKTEHCRDSQLCTLLGQCKLEGEACVAEAADCPKSALCLRHGKCEFDPQSKSCVFVDRCAAGGPAGCETCRNLVACKQSGLCSDNKNTATKEAQPCVAAEVTDSSGKVVGDTCKESLDCQEKGLCGLDKTKGVCTFSQCTGHPCDTYGRCSAQTMVYLGENTSLCNATSEDNCQNSSNCAARGNCHLKNNACVPTAQKECDDSTECKNNGYCTFRNDACILASDDNCQKSSLCRDEGACKFRASSCVVDSDVDCQNSSNCKLLGHCTRQPVKGLLGAQGPQRELSKCVALDLNCASHQDTCKLSGRCTQTKAAEYPDSTDPTKKISPTYGTCTATLTSCQSSEYCKQYGQCLKDPATPQVVQPGMPPSSVGTGCVAEPDSCKKERDPCKLYGRCKFAGIGTTRLCVASTDFECSESQICKEQGKCSKDPAGNDCIASNTMSCLQSSNCRLYGRCMHSGQACVASGASDCTNSVNCASLGYCSLVNNACVAASNTDCENSLRCKNSGYCTNLGSECYVLKDADCARSLDCTARGFCRHVNGRCCVDTAGANCAVLSLP